VRANLLLQAVVPQKLHHRLSEVLQFKKRQELCC